MDPLFTGYPYYTPYQFAGNRPIWAIDLDGLEEQTVTRIRNVRIFEFGKQKNGKIWDPSLGGKGSFVSSGETILEQGSIGGIIEVTNTDYTYDPFSKGYSSVTYTETIRPSIQATDPNDNSKEINTEPLNSQSNDTPVLTVTQKEDVVEQIQPKTIDKPETKIKPVRKTEPVYKPGEKINTNMQGLFYPYVKNTGIEFVSPTNKEFPAKSILKKIVKDINNSPGVTNVVISGVLCHGNGETGERVRASFYTGLQKLDKIMHDLGLNKKINVTVDYNKTKASKNSKADCAKIVFELK